MVVEVAVAGGKTFRDSVAFYFRSVAIGPVPDNSTVTVVIRGLDQQGTVLFEGRREGVKVAQENVKVNISAQELTPNPPDTVTAVPGGFGIRLNWNGGGSNRTRFVLYRRLIGKNVLDSQVIDNVHILHLDSIPADSFGVLDTAGMRAGRTFSYRIYTANNAGISRLFKACTAAIAPDSFSVAFWGNRGVDDRFELRVEEGAGVPDTILQHPGYSPGGWFTDPTFDRPWDFDTPLATDTALYAKWTENNHTLTFDAAGGTAPSPLTKGIAFNTAYGELATTSRDGYTFDHWCAYTDESCSAIFDTTIVSKDESHSLYARWTANEYTVTFDAQGGTTPEPVNRQVIYDDLYATLAATSREGYGLRGWFTEPSGGVEITEQTTVQITGDQTLYAQWNAPGEYNVTYNLGGGTNNVGNPAFYTVETENILFQEASRIGYKFDGWYQDNTTAITEIPQGSTGDKTLYARWSANEYTVTFDAQGGTTPDPVNRQVIYDGVYDALATTSRVGYTFRGWFTEPSGGVEISVGTEVQIAEAQTLYAQWSGPIEYYIIYNVNNGTNHQDNPAMYTVETERIVFQEASRTGYKFNGWYEDIHGHTPITEIPQGSTGERVLYARWTANEYTVTFDALGGTTPDPETRQVGYGLYYILAETSRLGYTFTGWFTEPIGGVEVTVGTHVHITGPQTLYAQWSEPIEYHITYNLNNGTNHQDNPAMYTVESETIVFQQPSRADWKFDDWYIDPLHKDKVTQIPSGSAGTIRLYAKWTWIGSDPVDGDGNSYPTVQIGNQVWMVENLRTTKYADGTDIPNVTDGNEWGRLSYGAYCYYRNSTDQDTVKLFGALYNWYVVNPGNSQKIAPEGWKVPSREDWAVLENYLIANGYNWDGTTEGNKIAKALASDGERWLSSNEPGSVGNQQQSNNSTGFTALPGRLRSDTNGNFWGFENNQVYWWTSTEYNSQGAYTRSIGNGDVAFRATKGYSLKEFGFHIRLVRD